MREGNGLKVLIRNYHSIPIPIFQIFCSTQPATHVHDPISSPCLCYASFIYRCVHKEYHM